MNGNKTGFKIIIWLVVAVILIMGGANLGAALLWPLILAAAILIYWAVKT